MQTEKKNIQNIIIKNFTIIIIITMIIILTVTENNNADIWHAFLEVNKGIL